MNPGGVEATGSDMVCSQRRKGQCSAVRFLENQGERVEVAGWSLPRPVPPCGGRSPARRRVRSTPRRGARRPAHPVTTIRRAQCPEQAGHAQRGTPYWTIPSGAVQ